MTGRAVGPNLNCVFLVLLALATVQVSARPSPQLRNEKRGYLILNYDTSGYSLDTSLLRIQVAAIVGSYLLTVVLLGGFLLTLGRRLRRKTQASPGTLEVEMVKPANLTAVKSGAFAHEPSPISPSTLSPSRSWFKGFKRSSSNASASLASGPQSPTSPGVESLASFDQAVLDRDRQNRESEMDRLYAAVAAHDAKQAKVVYTAVDPNSHTPPHSPPPTQTGVNDRRPPAINTNAVSSKDPSPVSAAASPRSPFKAIYPPDSPARWAPPPSNTQFPSPMSTSPPRNVLRRESQNSITSFSSKKARKSLRNLRISAPMQRYPGEAADDEARTPLSPRFYSPGPPPEPPSATSTNPAPLTPHTPVDADPATAYEQLDEPRPLPRPAPQRGPSHASNIGVSPVESVSSEHSRFGRPMPKSANNSTGTLPLRSITSDHAPAKTTLLSPRKDRFAGLRTAGGTLRTPGTGVPATPYSPYMPFTPITPVTPHLITKEERKQRKKAAGKRVAIQEDMVQDDKAMWD